MENATPLMIIHFNVVVLKVRLLNLNFLSLKNLGVVSKFIIIGEKEKCFFFLCSPQFYLTSVERQAHALFQNLKLPEQLHIYTYLRLLILEQVQKYTRSVYINSHIQSGGRGILEVLQATSLGITCMQFEFFENFGRPLAKV